MQDRLVKKQPRGVKRPSRASRPKNTEKKGITLSKKWSDEIKRRIDDADDPTRYIIRWSLFPRRSSWPSYYDISTDQITSDIRQATLFKRKRTAQVVANLLGELYVVERIKAGKDRRSIVEVRSETVKK